MRSWSPVDQGRLLGTSERRIYYIVFHGCAEHIPIEQPPVVWIAEQVEAESVDSSESEAEAKDPGDAMVVRRNMTADLFLPGRQPAVQQAPPPPFPPPPPEAKRGPVIPIRLQEGLRTYPLELLLSPMPRG